jgi:hypothetical protein
MVRSAIRRVWQVRRATVFVVGLVVTLTVLLSVATTVLAGSGVGAPFHLGEKNSVNATSRLVGRENGPMLLVENEANRARSTALLLRVKQGRPPLKVNSSTKVAKLNADKLDGKTARALGETLWAVVTINADHSITVTRSRGVTGSSKEGTGVYNIEFKRDVTGCAVSATIDQSQVGFISGAVNTIASTEREALVSTYDSDGAAADRPFQVVVHC